MKFLQGLSESVATWQGIVSIILVIVGTIAFYIISKNKGKSLSTRDVVAIGIGAALYGALSAISLPIGPNTSLRVAVALLTIFGAIFGPVVGFLVGFIGHALNDALMWGSVWWSWVFLSAVIGMFSGFVSFDKGFDVMGGKISKKHYAEMYIYTVIGLVVAGLVAFAGDVFLYGEPAAKVWLQLVLASISNFAVIAVIGIPVVIGIARMRGKNSNLDIEG